MVYWDLLAFDFGCSRVCLWNTHSAVLMDGSKGLTMQAMRTTQYNINTVIYQMIYKVAVVSSLDVMCHLRAKCLLQNYLTNGWRTFTLYQK